MTSRSDNWFDGLTERQRRFCEAYAGNGGNAMAAAKEAGYKKPHPQGAENLQKPTIIAALESMRAERTSASIATIDEVQRLWTDMARDTSSDPKDRLKASELLVKSQGGFLERVDATTRIVVEHVREAIDG